MELYCHIPQIHLSMILAFLVGFSIVLYPPETQIQNNPPSPRRNSRVPAAFLARGSHTIDIGAQETT